MRNWRLALADFLVRKLEHVPKRPCTYVIGNPDNPYLKRWYLLPRNPFFNVFLHVVLRSDDPRALHDHPWYNMSFIIKGAYKEIVPWDQDQPARCDFGTFAHVMEVDRKLGQFIFRRGFHRHRLVVDEATHKDVWTLFITGPVYRTWGFYCKRGWIPHQEFVDPENPRLIGKGCGDGQ